MKKTTKITFLGLFTAVALVLSFLETLIPNMVPIPGFKIGLANFAVLLALYLFGFKEAVIVVVPIPTMVTSPVEALTVATLGLEEL